MLIIKGGIALVLNDKLVTIGKPMTILSIFAIISLRLVHAQFFIRE